MWCRQASDFRQGPVMRHTGTLKSWNDERGFGFIAPDGARQDVFVHISAVPAINGRPLGGERLGFDLELDREGRQRAVHVRVLPPLGLFQSGGRVDDLPAAWTAPRLLIIPVFGGIYGAVSSQWGFYPYVLTGYVAVSLVSFLVYDLDKGAAMERRWRTREKTLHWLSLLGGWPGALVAQQWLRHKTSKPGFVAVFWVTVVLNIGLFVLLHACTDRQTVRRLAEFLRTLQQAI